MPGNEPPTPPIMTGQVPAGPALASPNDALSAVQGIVTKLGEIEQDIAMVAQQFPGAASLAKVAIDAVRNMAVAVLGSAQTGSQGMAPPTLG